MIPGAALRGALRCLTPQLLPSSQVPVIVPARTGARTGVVVSADVAAERDEGRTVLVTVCVDVEGRVAGLATTGVVVDGSGAEMVVGCRWVQTSAKAARATPTAAAATHIALVTCLFAESGAVGGGTGCDCCSLRGDFGGGVGACIVGPTEVDSASRGASWAVRARAKSVHRV